MIKLIKEEKTITMLERDIIDIQKHLSKDEYVELGMNRRTYERYMKQISKMNCFIYTNDRFKNNEMVIDIIDLTGAIVDE